MLRARARHLPRIAFAIALVCCGEGGIAWSAPASPTQQGVGDVIELHQPVYFEDLRALRSFFERVDVGSVAQGVSAPRQPASMAVGAVLTRLPSDWDAPFAFVQGAIRYVPYSGSVRSVDGTLESGAGNAVDQALLLQALLEARGVATRLMRGQLGWTDAARLVVGSTSPPAPRPDDPWPRWLEAAADHWWVQARADDDTWVDLDASFIDTAPGEVVAQGGRPQERIPMDLETTVKVELLRGDLSLADATLSSAAVVGQAVSLSLVAQSEAAVELWRTIEAELVRQGAWLRRFAESLGMLPPSRSQEPPDAAASATQRQGVRRPQILVPPRRVRPSALQRILLDRTAGPWEARLELPGQTLRAGPFELADLDGLVIEVSVSTPQAPTHVMRVPWGGEAGGRLSIVIAAGAVSDERLAVEARSMYRALDRLARIEQAALVDMRPPIDYSNAVDSLGSATRAEWENFAIGAPQALGWVLLQGVERASARSSGARVVRPGLRMVAVRWRPPATDRAGAFEVKMSDPITVGQLSGGATAAGLRAASGLLQSAVFSQVLNRVTDRAPDTAFDVTLRTIGTGGTLRTFAEPADLPVAWPAVARAEAGVGLSAGYRILAPTAFGDGGAGWWNISIADGDTIGWVPGLQTPLHGRVEVGSAGGLDRLEALLASLPALHRALRWLAELPGSGPTALASVPGAACASASVAAEFMGERMPAAWPRPDVVALCGLR